MKTSLILSVALVVAGAALAPAMAQDAALVFTALDTNKDGSLSKEEFMAAFGK